MTKHLTMDELNAGVPNILESPKDHGELKAIVIRPVSGARVSLDECEISPELGVHGDRWADGCWLTLPDGKPHPEVQVTMMNARAIQWIAQDRTRWPLAGDSLYVDLDISSKNLPVGQRLTIGSAVLEITDQAHTGCKKFAERFGADALKFVNSTERKELHLRGIYAKIVQAGVVHVGDVIEKIDRQM